MLKKRKKRKRRGSRKKGEDETVEKNKCEKFSTKEACVRQRKKNGKNEEKKPDIMKENISLKINVKNMKQIEQKKKKKE